MLEVEIKSRCDDLDAIKNAIVDLGGVYISTELEEDCYFNHPSRDFGKTDEALRIRKVNDMIFCTYKGPKLGGKTKTRFEKEVQIHDAEAMQEILQKLGFVLYGKVQKKRDVYLLNEVTICCDEVKGLGTFVELEMISNNREEAEKRLFALAQKLGLSEFITSSYLEMVKGG
ncbi:MAG: class IV adenylate cyclase [Spirochaetes bacterium]|nr:class IV adenylate cyclase [Spirochaetota bacterium]